MDNTTTNTHRTTFTFTTTDDLGPIRLAHKMSNPAIPQHTDEETSSSSRNINILAGPSALTCPHLRQFKTTKAFILATKCLGKWEKVGTLFQPANFSSNSAFGTTWQAWIPKVSIKLKLWWKRLKAAKFWLKTHHDGSVRARVIFFINAYG